MKKLFVLLFMSLPTYADMVVAPLDNTNNNALVEVAPSASSAVGVAGIPSTALESSHVLKASAGNLYGLIVTNSASGPTSGYVQIFNATSAPADGAVTPRQCFAAPPPGQSAAYGAIIVPDYYSTGITVVLSSAADCLTKTASAFAFFTGKVQ